MSATSLRLDHLPFIDRTRPFTERGRWQASWIAPADLTPGRPVAFACRLRLRLTCASEVLLHATADERYELWLDGRLLGRGPQRGDPRAWPVDSWRLQLAAGDHVLAAQVRWLGPDGPAPWAQLGLAPGFLCAAEGLHGAVIDTGRAPWLCRLLPGLGNLPSGTAFGAGARASCDATTHPWGWQDGDDGDEGWSAPTVLHPGVDETFASEHPPLWHALAPARLPQQHETPIPPGVLRHLDSRVAGAGPIAAEEHRPDEATAWQGLLTGQDLILPPRTRRRAIIDLGCYHCAYPTISWSGGSGSRLSLSWCEALLLDPPGTGALRKGDRNGVSGRWFVGLGDRLVCDGGPARSWTPPWWSAGRYVELAVESADDPLTLHGLVLRETGYPFPADPAWRSSDPVLDAIITASRTTLRLCAHETWMDCPYYEQLQYVADAHLQALAAYTTWADADLTMANLELIGLGRRADGLIPSRFPSRITQIIPGFALHWIVMLHDHAWWRGDAVRIRRLLPIARGILDLCLQRLDADGLPVPPEGWQFVDWVPEWGNGIPTGADPGPGTVWCWQVVWALRRLAALEDHLGEAEPATRWRRHATAISAELTRQRWLGTAFSDAPGGPPGGEHAVAWAVCADGLPEAGRQYAAKALAAGTLRPNASLASLHHVWEALARLGHGGAGLTRLGPWRRMQADGLSTVIEHEEPTRSDCHGWSAHPAHHAIASVLGVRPAAWGFEAVEVHPDLGDLEWVEADVPHPRGTIKCRIARNQPAVIVLPDGISGTLRIHGRTYQLHPGRNTC